jgi:hypothetical protein
MGILYDMSAHRTSFMLRKCLEVYQLLAVFTMIFSKLVSDSFQITFFQSNLAINVIIIIYFIYKAQQNLSVDQSHRSYKYNMIGVCIFVSSIAIWQIENTFCELYKPYYNIQLHALWHVLTSIGMFYLNRIVSILSHQLKN